MADRDMGSSVITPEGAFVIPTALRERFGMIPGSMVVAEEREDGILIRRSSDSSVHIYTQEEIAEFLLNNSVDEKDYRENREEVRQLGLDPDTVSHHSPSDW
jgi:AbrB family looped-hinge helix DNA binding protein